jgi:sulfide:quinone oxidoreductase
VATILILGGGIGGLVAAKRLRRALPQPHRVVLVEREPSFCFAPALTWLMTGDRTLQSISRPLERLVPGGIEVVRGEIEHIDAERRRVMVSGTAREGDHLVIALGAELAPELVPGLAGAGFSLYTPAGAGQLGAALARFEGGRIVVLTATPAYKCPAAPYESALLIESHLRRRGLRNRTEIAIYAAEAEPMATAGPEVAEGVRQMVESRAIAYHPGHQIVAADGAERVLRFANGATTGYDLLGFVPPHRAPGVVRASGLAPEGGWMATDRQTLLTSHDRVHAIGDVTSIPLASGRPLPKAGVFAHRQAEVVAHNIARELLGHGQPRTFDGVGECFIEAGNGRAGVGKGDFYAEPAPRVGLRAPSRRWHLAKVMIEKAWLLGWY